MNPHLIIYIPNFPKDIYIGWQFARIFHCVSLPKEPSNDESERSDETFHVDKTLIHDIIPQAGGGNEPI